MKKLVLLTLICITHNSASWAVGGADLLLQNVPDNDSVNVTTEQKTSASYFEGLQLKDPFAIEMFNEWKNAGRLDFEVNKWYLTLLQGKYEQAAHLLSVMKQKMPKKLYGHLRLSEIYLYHKLGLNQSFFDNWIDYLKNQKKYNQRLGKALAQYVDMSIPMFFYNSAVMINNDQREAIEKNIDDGTPFYTFARAALSLRKGKKAYPSLVAMPAGHPFRIPLAKTVVLDMARKGELAAAGKTLKRFLEPEIERLNDPHVLGEYYINLARFLYQAGAMDAANEYYLRIPDKHESFVQARAELMWSYLRTNNIAKLRGQVSSLKTDLFENHFIPEIYVVRSISNLKLCQYEEISKDFHNFIESNKKWAKQITDILGKEEVDSMAGIRDFFILRADKRVKQIENEIKKIERLAQRSIKAALPAVGEQPHWRKNIGYLNEELVQAKKIRLLEYKRPWKNREKLLAEAIKKMKFIKVEAMTQIRNMHRKQLQRTHGEVASRPILKKDELVFPYDGTFWPDEVLNLQAQAKSYCLQKAAL